MVADNLSNVSEGLANRRLRSIARAANNLYDAAKKSKELFDKMFIEHKELCVRDYNDVDTMLKYAILDWGNG